MYLLNRDLIRKYVDLPTAPICIKNFISDNLQHTFYYFTLGAEVVLSNESNPRGLPIKLGNNTEDPNDDFLILKPGDFATIKTQETFKIDDDIIGILGQCGDLIKEGLLLIHSPFVDPLFHGHFRFGIKNIGFKNATLEFGKSIIGKVCFFNISDTYPISIIKNSIIDKKFKEEF